MGEGDSVVEPKDIPLDFLVWLGKKNVVLTQEMPSGRVTYGKNMYYAEELVSEYWESFQ